MTDVTLSTMKDPAADMNTIVEAIHQLPPGADIPALWQTVASDSAYPSERRALAAVYLLARHARPGMTLGELVDLLARPDWLSSRDIEPIPWLMGELPVTWNDSDTYLGVQLRPGDADGYAAYIRLAGKVDAAAVEALLVGHQDP